MGARTCSNCQYSAISIDAAPCQNCSSLDHSLWKPQQEFQRPDNPYWERITALAEQQRKKGMSKYGYGLEMNPADILERINHLQEELIDAMYYCEWIKERIAND